MLKLREGWLTFLFLVVIITSVAWNINICGWTEDLGILYAMVALSVIVGLLLSRSIFPALIAHCFSFVYGTFTLGVLVAPMTEADGWRERIAGLGDRVVTWLTKATSGGTSRDTLMFVLMLGALLWLLGYMAAWYTWRRPRLWRALLPASLTILVNTYVYNYYTSGKASLTPSVIVFVITALLYAVRTNLHLRQIEWQGAQVRYDSDIGFDFMRAGIILALLATTVAWIAPGAEAGINASKALKLVDEPWSNVRHWWNRVFASLDTYNRTSANPFGSQVTLGGPRNLGDEIVMDISSPEGRYWRAVVYDRYTGANWINSDNQSFDRRPNERFPIDPFAERQEITQTVTVYLQGLTQIMAASQLVRVLDWPIRAEGYYESGELVNVSMVFSRDSLSPGDSYRVVSSISDADPDTLRIAGDEYPEWVQQRYLQLPDSVTERTRRLAQEITADYDNPYDQVEAIEIYLRDNLTYALTVTPPPDDQDFVDFVLFDSKLGYCDYYATSFVVLARSLGIPARIAMGYAQGEWDREARAFRVRSHNGHSWPEVYFPDYGWIEFEPTVVIAPIDRPEPPPPTPTPGGPETPVPTPGPADNLTDRDDLLPDEDNFDPGAAPGSGGSVSSQAATWLFVGLGLMIALVAAAGLTYWWAEIRGLRNLTLIEQAYAKLWRYAEWLGLRVRPDQTPYERADALIMLVPEGQTSITQITDLYVVRKFGRGSGLPEDFESRAQNHWGLLRRILGRTWLQSKLSRFQQEDYETRWQNLKTNINR